MPPNTRGEGEGGTDEATIARLLKDRANYVNGSNVEILAASHTSVRGPHVPSLKLDEVDEMDTDIRESAMGMCMGRLKRGKVKTTTTGSVVMTSTCHKINGPMAGLIERAAQGEFPLYTMCVFEVLEKCPEERSGEYLEKCPDCCLLKYCHDVLDGEPPKAKRSDGHYPIESLIQKFKTTGQRVFEADYLCKFSASDSAWFPSFTKDTHVSPRAECQTGYEVHLAIDSGVFTGAVFFQVVPTTVDGETGDEVHVFADYLSEGKGAQRNARAIQDLVKLHCHSHRIRVTTDPAGKARTAIGPTVLSEYGLAGLHPEPWPVCKVIESLALLESFVNPADEESLQLLVHPALRLDLIRGSPVRTAGRSGPGSSLIVPAGRPAAPL